MARYIDAEKINYHKLSTVGGHGLNYEYTVALKQDIDAIPAADLVGIEVCRCKDCAYAKVDIEGTDLYECRFYRDMRKGSDFCNYGERKE
jgi:hypothetical protein